METYGQIILAVVLLVSTLASVFFACHGANALSQANLHLFDSYYEVFRREGKFCFIASMLLLIPIAG